MLFERGQRKTKRKTLTKGDRPLKKFLGKRKEGIALLEFLLPFFKARRIGHWRGLAVDLGDFLNGPTAYPPVPFFFFCCQELFQSPPQHNPTSLHEKWGLSIQSAAPLVKAYFLGSPQQA
jgi:hypothetical protein